MEFQLKDELNKYRIDIFESMEISSMDIWNGDRSRRVIVGWVIYRCVY